MKIAPELKSRFKSIKTSVSLNKAAKILGYSYPTMRKYLDKGYIVGIQKGSRIEISLDELERFRREGNHLSPAEKASRAEQEALREQKPVDPSKFLPGHEPDPVELQDSAYPPYVHRMPESNSGNGGNNA